ncbi:hypothetical protein D1872_239440 [compost metagenome]
MIVTGIMAKKTPSFLTSKAITYPVIKRTAASNDNQIDAFGSGFGLALPVNRSINLLPRKMVAVKREINRKSVRNAINVKMMAFHGK